MWQDTIGNSGAILVPVFRVLESALLVVTGGAVDQQHEQVTEVHVRDHRCAECRHGPGECGSQLKDVVEVAGHAPQSGGEEQTLLTVSVIALVHGMDRFRSSSPDRALAARRPEHEPLPVGLIVEQDHGRADGHCRDEGPESERVDRGVFDEEEGGQSVESGDPGDASPALIEAELVDRNVNRAHVTVLPVEELCQVNRLQDRRRGQRVIDFSPRVTSSMQLIVHFPGPDDDCLPEPDSETTVDDGLEVEEIERSKAGVQLNSPVEIKDWVS